LVAAKDEWRLVEEEPPRRDPQGRRNEDAVGVDMVASELDVEFFLLHGSSGTEFDRTLFTPRVDDGADMNGMLGEEQEKQVPEEIPHAAKSDDHFPVGLDY